MMYYDFLVANLPSITAIHIHSISNSDVFTGPIYLPSDMSSLVITPVNNEIIGSLGVTYGQASAIINDPTSYYVLIKTAAYPSGAVCDFHLKH